MFENKLIIQRGGVGCRGKRLLYNFVAQTETERETETEHWTHFIRAGKLWARLLDLAIAYLRPNTKMP